MKVVNNLPTKYGNEAENIIYDNSVSNLQSGNVQDALDEIVDDLLAVEYDAENETLIVPDSVLEYDSETETITFSV